MPLWKTGSCVEDHPGRGNGDRHPIADRLDIIRRMDASAYTARITDRITIVAAVAHHWPAIVAARNDLVDFVPALGPVLSHPQLISARADCRTLRVAMPVAEDLGFCADD